MRFSPFFLFVPAALPMALGLGATFPPFSGGILSCPIGLAYNPSTLATLVDNYAQVVGNYSEALAQSFLSDEFQDVSDSINVLAGIPLGSVTFPSKEAFMASQATQPKIPVIITASYAITPDTVAVRYTQTFGAGKVVAGISILGFVCDQDDWEWKLQTIYTEFNSLVYFQNIGGSCVGS